MSRIFAIATLVVCMCASAAQAQTVQRPTRPYRGLFGGGPPPDPNRMRHELTFTASLLGGYDDYVTPATDGTDPAPDIQNGFSTNASATLNYFYGRAARSFSADMQALSTAYYNAGVNPTLGGDLTLTYSSDVGRRSRIGLTQDLGYEPTLVLGAFGALAGDVENVPLPESGAGVSSGLVEQRSWSAASTFTAEHRWTTRQTSSGNLGYSKRTYLDSLGFDNTTLSADIRHSSGLSRTTAADFTYRYSTTDLAQTTGGNLPLTDHTIEVGTSYTRRLSATRQVVLAGGGGATYVQTETSVDRLPLEYWMPSGHATVRLEVGRSWSFGADYRRAVSVLQGVTVESFPTDAISVRADGTIGPKVETALSVAYSTGRSGGVEQGGNFGAYGGTAQLRYALARCCAMSVNYDYYLYRLRNFSSLPVGLPAEYDRNAIRVGFTLWLPLYGSYGQAEGGGRGRTAPAR
jgi:hypothetical protein